MLSLEKVNFELLGMKVNIIVWDNSEDGLYENEYLDAYPHSFLYIHTPENKPLSKLYNCVVDRFIIDDDYSWLVIFDDDTEINSDYFIELKCDVDKIDVNLAVPRISNKSGKVISPGKLYFTAGRSLESSELFAGMKDSSKYLALMSAIAIRKRTFLSGLRFDESLSFYGIDTKFLLDYQKKFRFIYFMNTHVFHESKLDDLTDGKFEENYKRLSMLITSWSKSLNLSFSKKLLLLFYIPLFAIKKSIVLRNVKYICLLRFVLSIFNK